MSEAERDGPPVLVERRDTVLLVTINRPGARNAADLAVHLGIGEALEEADRDDGIRVVILTGAGDRSFCAGVDLKALARGEPLRPADAERAGWGFAGYVRHAIGKPTIAAVNGAALGGGTELALASDLAICAPHATFGLPEVKLGLLAGAGGAFRLLQHLPRKVAMELLLSGASIDAERALALGLVNEVAPPGQLLDRALALAARIAANAPLSVRASKRVALGIEDRRIEADERFWALTEREAAALMRSEDATEGPRAFAQKRPPRWTGR